jgi:hypothetical protein
MPYYIRFDEGSFILNKPLADDMFEKIGNFLDEGDWKFDYRRSILGDYMIIKWKNINSNNYFNYVEREVSEILKRYNGKCDQNTVFDFTQFLNNNYEEYFCNTADGKKKFIDNHVNKLNELNQKWGFKEKYTDKDVLKILEIFIRNTEKDNHGKIYYHVKSLRNIIKVLAENGYSLGGKIIWRGDDIEDTGTITINNNVMEIKRVEF